RARRAARRGRASSRRRARARTGRLHHPARLDAGTGPGSVRRGVLRVLGGVGGERPTGLRLVSPGPAVVATGLQFGEGPVWCPARGDQPASLVCTAVAAGAVERVDLATGEVRRVADVAGGANAAVLASDGGFLVTQNGGIDFASTPYPDPPPYRPVTPGLQRVRADGSTEYVVTASTDAGAFL